MAKSVRRRSEDRGHVVSPFEAWIGDVFEFLMLSVMIPLVIVVFSALGIALVGFVAFGVVTWVLEPAGLVEAWRVLADAKAAPAAPLSFVTGFLQNMVWAVFIGGLLSIPTVRRVVSTYQEKSAYAARGAVAAAGQAGLAGLALHVLLSAAIAAALSALGVVLPAPGGEWAHAAIIAGAGGWPPGPDEAGGFLVVVWTVLIVGGAIVGALLGGAVAGIGGVTLRGAASGAVSGAGGALGKALTRAISKEYSPDRDQCVLAGAAKGAMTGAVYAFVLFAGAALVGWG